MLTPVEKKLAFQSYFRSLKSELMFKIQGGLNSFEDEGHSWINRIYNEGIFFSAGGGSHYIPTPEDVELWGTSTGIDIQVRDNNSTDGGVVHWISYDMKRGIFLLNSSFIALDITQKPEEKEEHLITLPLNIFLELTKSEKFLKALKRNGVENWEGWENSIKDYNNEQ